MTQNDTDAIEQASREIEEWFRDATARKDDAEIGTEGRAYHSGRVAAYAEALQILHHPFLGEDRGGGTDPDHE